MSTVGPSRRRLILLRHAKSDWPTGVDDHERPLRAGRGRQASALMGKYMAREGLAPDLVIVSTARRAQETWDLACSAFAQSIPRRDDPRLYEATAGMLLQVVHETRADIHTLLLVGHHPGLQSLVLELLAEATGPVATRLRDKYPTGGLVVIDFDVAHWNQVRPATGKIRRFETPRSIDSGN
ncbi:MAG: histidine phosphatase family protein [Castellaniella sp.]|nr:histidine phosphatase family protein [Castellaniella sp.]